MYKNLVNHYSNKYLAVWVILFLDILVVFSSFELASLLRHNFDYEKIDFASVHLQGLITAFTYLSVFKLSRTSSAIMRHTSFRDLARLLISVVIASCVLVIINVLAFYGFGYTGIILISKSILIIQALLVVLLLSSYRMLAKAVYGSFLNTGSKMKTHVIIYGAGVSGLITKKTLLSSSQQRISVLGFIDDNPALQGKTVEGLPIYPYDQVINQKFIERHNISEVIFSIADLNLKKKRKIIDSCLHVGVKVREVPTYDKWVHGELSLNQIKPVKIEDLLGRSVISLDSVNIRESISNRVVLITGGAGSIGSEIVKQVLYFNPTKVIALDHGETSCYQLNMNLLEHIKKTSSDCEVLVANITNFRRMQQVFEQYKPDIVFHAAAYKHVPLMEGNPIEAVSTNVFGTKNIADLSIRYGVQKFVMVSTDKAINPTNVMGATKRIAEMYVQSMNNEQEQTQFIITRFGNVLGSNGSVIPLFKKQIEKGGPITLTHKDITRYFMTISEACNLVLEAGSIGSGGEIFIFDMGKSVKILDLARKMIRLSGLTEGVDIEIEFVGLRPGEKLYEELLATEENTLPTHHPKIMKAKIKQFKTCEINQSLIELASAIDQGEPYNIVSVMKKIVPEFRSNNSQFSSLDRPKPAFAS